MKNLKHTIRKNKYDEYITKRISRHAVFISRAAEYKSSAYRFIASEIINQSSLNIRLSISIELIDIVENRVNPKTGKETECTMI